MPRIFNSIRQKLLSQNLPDRKQGRFTRYLIYAVGEIVLVVIGILIACTSPSPWRGVPAHNSINL